MKKISRLMFLSLVALCLLSIGTVSAQKTYNYETVPNDPMKTRIYTLDNGLKVFLSVYKDAPRIQTYIAVKVGSKNDPKETTGLAHYFEHMMFKGSTHFGTKDFAKEGPMIAKIDSLFEIYRGTKDSARRTSLYHLIDSISFEASKIAIPNEYDKMMSTIGASGTNAFTALDQTVYVEDIPANQMENWLTIEADRFMNPVLRLFHTELETIYEEKNMTLTDDNRKVYTAMLEGLYPHHPYGTQTTIGEAEHLRNPSMTNIRAFHAKYYVPNNMAICLSGDLDPDKTIELIDKYFGVAKSSPVPAFTYEKEQPITAPIVKEVVGPDAENLSIAFRFDGANSKDAKLLSMVDMILANSNCGLIDLNLNKAQKVLGASSSPLVNADYCALALSGKPKAGQTLEQVRDLLLAQIELLKKGEFPDWMMQAIINDFKLNKIRETEDNNSRAMAYVDAFINNISWKDEVANIDEMSKITKQDVIEFANKHLNNNYVIVYKRSGKDKKVEKVKKPKITKIQINRDIESDFSKKITANKVQDIEPVFIDFKRDIQTSSIKNNTIPVLYKENVENKTFDLTYYIKVGTHHDKLLSMATSYVDYLGTSKYTSDQINQEFYKLGCSWNIGASDEESTISLSGLSENLVPALKLFEEVIADLKPNKEALTNLVDDILKSRANSKKNQKAIFGRLYSFGLYGKNSPSKNILTEKELKALDAQVLVDKIKSLPTFNHDVIYYGSHSMDEIKNILEANHKAPATLLATPATVVSYTEAPIKGNRIYFVDFDMKQATLMMLSQSKLFDPNMYSTVQLFNEYFGGSMNSIVFQELREARSLAYTAMNSYGNMLGKKNSHYYNMSYIQTQSDKLNEAMTAFYDLINAMPEAEQNFELAKTSIIQNLRTERITKSDIIYNYIGSKKLGIDYDIRRDVFTKVPTMTLADIKKFEEENVKPLPRTILVMGPKSGIDFKALKKFGKITTLNLEDLFGY